MLLTGHTKALAEENLLFEETKLAVTIKGEKADLEVLIAKEQGASKPLPLVIFTHGQYPDRKKRKGLKARNYEVTARDFARRGWIAAIVLRRGYGQSNMRRSDYRIPNCANRNYSPTINEQTDDLEAAIKAIAKRRDVDATTILAVGVSAGGVAALNLGTRDIPGLKGVINFSGGIATKVAPGKKQTRKTCRSEDLVRWFDTLKSEKAIPSLWLYAENDSLFSPELVRHMHERYIAANGKADLRMLGPSGKDGHLILSNLEAALQWQPAIDNFLRSNGLSTYDPKPLELAIAQFSPSARRVATRYHGRPTEKALAVSKSGKRAAAQYNARALDVAESKALQACERQSGEQCRILWRNFEVVP